VCYGSRLLQSLDNSLDEDIEVKFLIKEIYCLKKWATEDLPGQFIKQKNIKI
jgi:hypothetical protein